MNNCITYLETTVARFPERIAISDGKISLTYRELKNVAQILAIQLRKISHQKNQPVAILIPKSISNVVSFLATLYSGHFYVPLDTKAPAKRLQSILDDLHPMAVITCNQFWSQAQILVNGQYPLLNIDDINITEQVLSPTLLPQTIDIDPIYCIYTSGSTGSPKGVVVSHRNVIDYIEWFTSCFPLDEHSIVGNQSPFHFDVSTTDIYACLKMAATLYIIPEQLFAFPVKLIEYVEEQHINFIFWVPTALTNIAARDALSAIPYQGLKTILFAGEVMPRQTLRYWREKFPKSLMANLYGPTEVTVIATYYILDEHYRDEYPLPIGHPCRNSDVLILNEDNQEVANDEMGELCIRGTLLALGYWRDFAKTEKSFIQNPLNPYYPEKIYRTGDLVKRNQNGEILYYGRKDHQIKHMGYRIELGEIESASQKITNISNACAFYDERAQKIILFYESKNEHHDEFFIKKELAQYIPKYMIPETCIRTKCLPLSGSGKIDRPLIKELYLSSAKETKKIKGNEHERNY